MPTSPTTSVIEHLRRTVLREAAELGDGELLGRFLERHDEAALAALVRRHGPMVWGVCRRLLGHHDAEDAFQATFLVLVRKAASVVPRELVGNFLYGVAHQTALQARRTAARRRAREVQVTVMPDTEAVPQEQWLDVKPLLDQELSRLPDIYRTVVVLCDLEGRTRKEVARQLGVPEGTVAGRLARARAMLAKRLTERGVTLSGGVLAAVLSRNLASAGVPNSVVSSTIQAASLLAAGQAAAGGAISVKVAALTEGVMKAMLFTKLRAALAVVLILAFVATGATILTCRTAAGQDDKQPAAPAAEKPVEPAAKQEKEKETFTAWGKEIAGLQAGLGFRPGEKRAYHHGETVTLVVRIRNVDKEEVTFQYVPAFFKETPPTVKHGTGEPVLPIRGVNAPGKTHPATAVTIAPGKEVELYEWNARLAHDPLAGGADDRGVIYVRTGKFSVQYERVLGNSSASRIKIDPALSKLATGKLELEVKEPEKPPGKKDEKEPFTAWGKEINGLQAGLGFRAGEKRTYSHGEGVVVVLRVRNVGKEAVEFKHIWAFFVENYPTVTDADGKRVQLPGFAAEGAHHPRDTSVAPGKEVVLYEWSFDLRAQGEDSRKGCPTIHGVGKFGLQCERVVGPTSANPNHPNPALDKLATGKLELEVKEPEKQPQKKEEKEPFTAWGNEVNGLQAGLGYPADQKRAYAPGETVRLAVRARNVGKEEVKFRYAKETFFETPPSVTDSDGKQIPLKRRTATGFVALVEVKLAPGKEIELAELKLEPRTATQSVHEWQWNLLTTGKFTAWYDKLEDAANDNTLSKLATGKLELEIKSDPPPAAESGKGITIRVVIEKVNADSRAITASCVALGEIDGERKPLRLENLSVSKFAKVRINGKERALADLKARTEASLELDGRESTLTVVGIEVPGDHPPAGVPDGRPNKE